MRYLPHTPQQIKKMLEVIGVEELEALFSRIPQQLRLGRTLDLPPPLDEQKLIGRMNQLASANKIPRTENLFAGCGIYNHHVPSVIDHILLRGEFFTAYTPYQPELSQGTLQAIFEYQSLMSKYLGMEVTNASMYDGSTSVAEAALMAVRIFKGKRKKIVVAGALHPEYRDVLDTYCKDIVELCYVGFDAQGLVPISRLSKVVDDTCAGVVVQSPNFWGLVENLTPIKNIAEKAGALMIVSFTEALSFGLLAPPGDFGADIVAGEGQSLGLHMNFGGPLLGILSSKREYVRSLPGRLVGRSVDRNGRPAYVLTLTTREQHIRRGKATSNICTNEGLCALAATIYLALAGPEGLRKVSLLCHAQAVKLRRAVQSIPGVSVPYQAAFFNEFVLDLSGKSAEDFVQFCAQRGLIPGVAVSRFLSAYPERLVVCATECTTDSAIDLYVSALDEFMSKSV